MAAPNVLVTGGAGFIGSNIVAELTKDAGCGVIVCDRLRDAASGKWRNLARHGIADLIFPEELFGWLETHGDALDLVIHMGAVSSTTEADVDRIFGANFALSRDLFRWCARSKAPFIYASSAATYGDASLGFDDRQDLDWLGGLRPLNPYGWSKTLFDLFAVREAAMGRAPPWWTGLKFFNVYGPNEGHKGAMASIVAQMWPTVVAGGSIGLFRSHREGVADGGQSRDFVYVRDVADCVAWLARSKGVTGVYNLGSGRARSFADLASAMFAAAGKPVRIDYKEMPEAIRGSYQYYTCAAMGRLRAAGWRREPTSLEDGVADYVRNYLATDDPYR
jgi:ADP-L-glycero-D-manno-heptose 6-epimerase